MMNINFIWFCYFDILSFDVFAVNQYEYTDRFQLSYDEYNCIHIDRCVFTLTNPFNIKPTIFSNGHIILGNAPNETFDSSFYFPQNFTKTTDHGCELFTGNKHFMVNEIEAYETDVW